MSEVEKSSESESGGLKLFLVEALTKPLAWLPRRWLLFLGAVAGRLAFHLWSKRRSIALGNLEMIKANGSLPSDLPAAKVARESFANMGRTLMEALCFYHRGFGPFEKYCLVEEGREHLDHAVAEITGSGRGLLMVTGHMGNWEIMSQLTARLIGRHLGVVGRETGKPLADALTRKLRTRDGNSFISKRGGALEMMRLLKGGGVIGTLIDQAVVGNHPGLPLPFLGRAASTNLGPLRLAKRAKVPVLMVLFRREGLYHYLKAQPMLDLSSEDERSEEILAETAGRLNDWLGRHIQQYPDQWMWGHRRWKSKEGIRRDPGSII